MPDHDHTREATARGGFSQTVQPDQLLAQIVGDAPITRANLTRRVWNYIKANKLQDGRDRRRINADARLAPLFDGQEQVSMFALTRLINRHVH